MLEIKENVPLAQYTTFKIGGPARYFTDVGNEAELKEALEYAQKNSLPIFVLGGGSNLLISDGGFSGLVIKVSMNSIKMDGGLVECGAGVSLSKLLGFCQENGLSGLEWAAGIPCATVGGAVFGNAGAFGKGMADIVEKVRVLEISESTKKSFIRDYENKDCAFGYRTSIFKKNSELIILSSLIKFNKSSPEDVKNKISEVIKKRREKDEFSGTAGSFFKNPEITDEKIIEEFEKDTGKKVKSSRIPAGWLIDNLELKGKKIGGAKVSEKSANFIINTGGAKAEDVIMLASVIKQKVRNHYGIQLEEEVRYVGF